MISRTEEIRKKVAKEIEQNYKLELEKAHDRGTFFSNLIDKEFPKRVAVEFDNWKVKNNMYIRISRFMDRSFCFKGNCYRATELFEYWNERNDEK